MNKRGKNTLLLLTVLTSLALILIIGAKAYNPIECWNYPTYDECNNDSTMGLCRWDSQSLNCMQKGCWDYTSNDTCQAAIALNLSCSWSTWTSMGGGGCESVGCGSFTSQADCAGNKSLGCIWDSSGSYCYEIGCWSYGSSDCESTHASGLACKWDSTTSNCENRGCWSFDTVTECNAANATYGIKFCKWNSDYYPGYCYEENCWDYNYNQTGCNELINAGKGCVWNDPNCEMKECMNYDQNTCSNVEGCVWYAQESHGDCEELGCWSTNFNTNESACEDDTDKYGLDCDWANSYCMENMTAKTDIGCGVHTFKAQCTDFGMGWCVWNSTGETCIDPPIEIREVVGGGGAGMGGMTNPGCWIFNYCSDGAECNNLTVGTTEYCNWNSTTRKCSNNASTEGLQCYMINNSDLCNNLPALSNCCTWNGTGCMQDPYTATCRDSMRATEAGKGFCEDYGVTTNTTCWSLSCSPYYMPCEWNSTKEECKFAMSDKFGSDDKTASFEKLGKNDCDWAGGTWIEEKYCNGVFMVTTGWCIMETGTKSVGKGSQCDGECWACEWKDSSNNVVTETNAQSACEGSALGICQFTSVTNAPNGIGWCDPKDEFKMGLMKDCKDDCASCTWQGDLFSTDTTKTPKYNCEMIGPNCTWFTDPLDPTEITKGWCGKNTEKGCEGDCYKCPSQTTCMTTGTNCTWETTTTMCRPDDILGAGTREICFDGIDNNDDGKIDCSDGDCMTDTFCGGGFLSDCGMWPDQGNCTEKGCSWLAHENRCDMAGAACWMYDTSEGNCTATPGCMWSTTMGGDYAMSDCSTNNTASDNCLNTKFWNSTGCYDTGCYQDNQTACDELPECVWWKEVGMMEGQCKFQGYMCHDNYSKRYNPTECTADPYCHWDPYWGDDGECDIACYNYSITETDCTNTPACIWAGGEGGTTGMCEPMMMMDGGVQMEMGGTGGMGGMGMGGMGSCFVYDQDQTLCNNATGCSWQTMMMGGMCEVKMELDCPTLSQAQCTNASLLNSTATDGAVIGNCTWQTDSWGGGWCDFKVFECGFNSTKQNDIENCTSSSNCIWTSWSTCEPACFNSSLKSDTCALLGNCFWRDGFCESSSMVHMMQGMEGGPPIHLMDEATGDATNNKPLQDIIHLGMKDTPKSMGIGIGVDSIVNASFCNGQQIITGGTSRQGSGTEEAKFYYYLDTDGTPTGDCNAINSTYPGYEFKVKYETSVVNGSVSEVTVFYKCTGSSWVSQPITVKPWAEIACNMLGGGLVMIEKEDLNSHTEYNPTNDFRILGLTADNATNESNPVDIIGPAYYTPGQIDKKFEMCGMVGFDMDGDGLLAEDDPDCLDFKMFGGVFFMEGGPMCLDSIDNDNNGLTDCADPGCCWDIWFCPSGCVTSAGVAIVDTKAPTLAYIDPVTYPDGALIYYDTSEPSNGTVFFYGTDSTCTTLNATINDTASLSKGTFKKWHTGTITNFTWNPTKIDQGLANATTHYFKIKICDDDNNCATTGCMEFTTEATTKTCGKKCKTIFTPRYTPPTGSSTTDNMGNMTFIMDWDSDGVEDEEIKCLACGAEAGFSIDYNNKNASNATLIMKNPSNTSWEMKIKKIDLTGGFPKELKNITGDDMIMNETSDGAYIGILDTVIGHKGNMIKDKLRPESIEIGIPGNFTSLYHCDAAADYNMCANVTANVTRIGYNSSTSYGYTSWDIPAMMGLSTYGPPATAPPSGDGTTTSAGGGGGGAAAGGAACEEDWTCTEWEACRPTGTQARICTDANECGKEEEKPIESRSCEYKPPTEEVPEEVEKPSITEKLPEVIKKRLWLWISMGVIAVVVVVVLLSYFIPKMGMPKPPTEMPKLPKIKVPEIIKPKIVEKPKPVKVVVKPKKEGVKVKVKKGRGLGFKLGHAMGIIKTKKELKKAK